MARLSSWRDQLPQSYAGAQKWGTGINPIHARRDGNESRNNAPTTYDPPETGLVPVDFGYVDESYVPGMDLTFMETHPNLSDPSNRGTSDMVPWGIGNSPIPQGNMTRIRKRGMSGREVQPNVIPNGPAGEGWENKNRGPVLDSNTADDSQLFVQTSMRQRDQIRNNGAAVSRGTDVPRETIGSRIVGMRLKTYSGGYRHVDMEPKAQDYRTRPWKYRGAGTGDVSWMTANEFQSVEPITREIPPDVYQGPSENAVSDESYTDEEWYM